MPAALDQLLACLGSEVDDPDEETFILFAHERPLAQNLGFVDAHATTLDLTVAGRDLVIHQSPGVLTSSRPGGTTGAVLWKITPAVAEWLANPGNILFRGAVSSSSSSNSNSRRRGGDPGNQAGHDDADRTAADGSNGGGGPPPPPLLGPHSAVLELGCGISGVIGLVLTGKGSSSSSSNSNSNSNSRSNSRSKSSTGRASKRSHGKASLHGQSHAERHHDHHTHNNTVGRYVLTDQPYVAKLVQTNLEENGGVLVGVTATSSADHRNNKKRSSAASGASASSSVPSSSSPSAIFFRPLDWETDEVTPALLLSEAEQLDHQQSHGSHHHHHHHHPSPDRSSTAPASFDAVLACDCIYNEALVAPLVQTCADACRLRVREIENREDRDKNDSRPPPTLCIVAQQLRDPDVLTSWLAAFHASFRVWRVPEEHLPPALWPEAGFAVHIGILRDARLGRS